MAHNPRYGNWKPEQWRDLAPTLADLRRHGFEVVAKCQTCNTCLAVDIPTVAAARGWDFTPWGRTVPCRRWRCSSRMRFWVCPPQINRLVEMF